MKRWRLVAVCGAGALLLASGFLPWLRLAGRDFTGYGMARLLIIAGDDYPVIPPSWVGIVWYGIPVCAAVAWVAAFWRSTAMIRPVHRWLAVPMLALTAGYVAACAHYGAVRFGAYVALAGALTFATAGFATHR